MWDFVKYRCQRYFSGPVGKYVALTGDHVTYRGVKLDLSNDVIDDSLKARFVLGTYEDAEMRLIKRHLPSDTPVVDLGGGIGFISCFIANTLHGVPQIVVEANPNLIRTIETNRDLNGHDFSIKNVAYSPTGEELDFYLHKKFVGGSAQRTTKNSVTIDGRRLESLLDEFEAKEFTLVSDIEGGEFELLDAELDFLTECCRALLIEFHDFTEAEIDSYRKKLEHAGFEAVETCGDVSVYINQRLNS